MESFSLSVKDSVKHNAPDDFSNSAGDTHKYGEVSAKALNRHAAIMNNHHKTNDFKSDVNSTHIIAKDVRLCLNHSTALTDEEHTLKITDMLARVFLLEYVYHSAVSEAAMRPAKYIFTIYFRDLDMERSANGDLYELIGQIISSINHTDLRIHLELVLISSGQNMTNSSTNSIFLRVKYDGK